MSLFSNFSTILAVFEPQCIPMEGGDQLVRWFLWTDFDSTHFIPMEPKNDHFAENEAKLEIGEKFDPKKKKKCWAIQSLPFSDLLRFSLLD